MNIVFLFANKHTQEDSIYEYMYIYIQREKDSATEKNDRQPKVKE